MSDQPNQEKDPKLIEDIEKTAPPDTLDIKTSSTQKIQFGVSEDSPPNLPPPSTQIPKQISILFDDATSSVLLPSSVSSDVNHSSLSLGSSKQAMNASSISLHQPKLALAIDQNTIVENEEDDKNDFLFGALFNIDHSPAFKFLEQKRAKKELSEKRMGELKEYMRNIHGFLLSSNDFEKKLAKKVQTLQTDVGNQRLDIDQCGTKQFAGNASIGELKRELLKIENEAQLASDRESKLSKDLEESQQQKAELISEIDEIRKHKADMIEPQLIGATKELKLDVIQRRNQVDNLEKDLEEKESTLDMCAREKDHLEIERDKLAVAIAKAAELPLKIMKQCEVLRNGITSLISENVKQSSLSVQLDVEIDRLDFEERKLDQAAEYEQRKAEIHEMERQCDDIFKEHELAKEQLTGLKTDKLKFELQIKHFSHQMKREHDILLRSLREKEQQLKLCRRLEMTVNNIHMSTAVLASQREETERHLQVAKREEKVLRKEITKIRKEIDLSLFDFLKQEQIDKTEMEKIHLQFVNNQKLEETLNRLIEESQGLEKNILQAQAVRELKSRNAIRIAQKLTFLKEENAMKHIAIMDNGKRCAEAVQRLKDFATMYDVVKNERNKYMNQIQTTMQRSAEMKEKIRILTNEIEILRHEISNKERELQKKRQENDAIYSLRDTAKNEANKAMSLYRDRRDHIGQQLSQIDTLNMVINAAEEDMLTLKARFAQAAKDRNSVGMQLLDRNDELCILFEKINIQIATLNKGQEMLMDRDEEIRKFEIIKNEVKREVELLKTLKPKVIILTTALEKVQQELEDTKNRMIELSSRMESPDDPKRCRYLGGKDPKRDTLLQKIQNLEELLAEKEEKLLERDLILTEISTMTNRVKSQTLDGRSESKEVAMKLNDLAKRIRTTTRSMMGKVSELSMHQALALSLYQQKCEKEALLENARLKMRDNPFAPPWESVEQEIKRSEKQRMRREIELMKLAESRSKQIAQASGRFVDLDDEGFYLLEKMRTTAEPRPNAYLPDAIGLPIPKPYGSHAPFKPSESGSQMRHFRKPVVKPIEI